MARDGLDTADIDFASLFDLEELQHIQDAFSSATGVASIITSPDGTPITRPSNFVRLCQDIIRGTQTGRANCFKSDAVLGRYDPSGPTICPCLSGGLWDAGASIRVDGRHVASWLIGQVRDETSDTASLMAYADVIGADREQYRQALEEVPVMSPEKFKKVAESLFLLANQLSNQAFLIHRQKALLDESRAANESLRLSEEAFRTIFDCVNECIFVHDPDTMAILDVNKRACAVYGYSREEMISMEVHALSSGEPPYDGEHAAQRMQLASAGLSQCFEWHARKRNGSLFWMEATIQLAPVGGKDLLLVSCRDITDRTAAQEEARKERALTDAIFDSVPGIIYLYDDMGRLIRWNRKHSELTGYTDEELSRMTLADWYKDDPDELAKIMEAVKRIHEDGFSAAEGNLRNKDGSKRLYYFTAVPLEIEGKRYFTGIGIDITDHKRMQDVMVRTEKMLSVAGLAAGMAHEINNPLSAIMQSAQVLEMRLFKDTAPNERAALQCGCSLGNVRDYLVLREGDFLIEGIKQAAARAARIVANMLEFNRRETRRAPCNLAILSEKAVELCCNDFNLTKKYDFRTVSIQREYDPVLPPVSCTETQIEQVLLNLLRNAAQATCAGTCDGTPPKVLLRTRLEQDWAVLEVSDNGPGMDESLRARVFEPFFTTKDPGVGTGLGLSVSYFIVTERHKGSIQVESTPGKGSCFTVRLPLADPKG